MNETNMPATNAENAAAENPASEDSLLALSLGMTPENDPLSSENSGENEENLTFVPHSPEGYRLDFADNTAVNEELLEDFRELAHQLGITQKQAQKLAGFYENRVGGGLQQYTKKLQEKEQHWRTEIKQQPGYRQTISDARRAMETYASKELIDLFNHTRIGSHPAMVRFMSKVGRALAEPSAQGERSGRLLTTAEVLYPSHTSKN